MRFLALLAFNLVSLAFHNAQASALPTLCTAEEHVVISGETPRGFASLCAGKNDVWHYRFGEPGHVTYVFPHNNSPARENFSYNTLSSHDYTDEGYLYHFKDNTIDVSIFSSTDAWWENRFYRDHNDSDIPSYDISARMLGTIGGVIIEKDGINRELLPFCFNKIDNLVPYSTNYHSYIVNNFHNDNIMEFKIQGKTINILSYFSTFFPQ